VKKFGIGQAVTRLEDDVLLRGQGTFTANITLENQAYGYVLRSPVAHANITSLDVSEAKLAEGVLAIYTYGDVKDKLGNMPCNAPIPGKDGKTSQAPDHYVLADDRVRHVGEAVAFVVAESLELARNASELIEVDYDDLVAVVGLREALSVGAVEISPNAPGNLSLHWALGDEADVDSTFQSAAHVTSLDVVNNRVIPNSIETRAANGVYDEEKGYTLYVPSQGVWGLRNALANHLFDVEPSRIQVITGDVGGGFGMKGFVYGEYALSMLAAKELGRPVKWVADRSESFVSDAHGRDNLSLGELAFDADGKILAYRVKTLAAFGAYLSQFAPFIPTAAAVQVLGGVYSVPKISVDVKCVLTNTPPVDAYRGAGRPEAAYLLERVMDKAAHELGLAPEELRRRNFIPKSSLPYKNATGAVIDSGDFETTMSMSMKEAMWDSFSQRKAKSAANGMLRGIGMGYYIECTLGDPVEEVSLNFTDAGRVELFVGTQTNGQGHLTTFGQILVEKLDLDISLVDLIQGDSDKKASGGGTAGSRSLQMIGNAAVNACTAVVEKGEELAKLVLAADIVSFDDGVWKAEGTNRTIDVMSLAKEAQAMDNLPEELSDGLNVTVSYKKSASTFPNGCHIAEVEIDPDTGKVDVVNYTVVDDIGVVINPLVVAGQVHGGVVQGLGQALTENCVYEEGTGQLLTGSFMDYGMPRADDISNINFSTHEVPCTTNPLGIKGCGEAGTIGAMPSIMNAVVHAVRERGIMQVDMPATPLKMWNLLNKQAAS
jgi:carbon-monoxide dehydrogenase large subunit